MHRLWSNWLYELQSKTMKILQMQQNASIEPDWAFFLCGVCTFSLCSCCSPPLIAFMGSPQVVNYHSVIAKVLLLECKRMSIGFLVNSSVKVFHFFQSGRGCGTVWRNQRNRPRMAAQSPSSATCHRVDQRELHLHRWGRCHALWLMGYVECSLHLEYIFCV